MQSCNRQIGRLLKYFKLDDIISVEIVVPAVGKVQLTYQQWSEVAPATIHFELTDRTKAALIPTSINLGELGISCITYKVQQGSCTTVTLECSTATTLEPNPFTVMVEDLQTSQD